MEFRIQQSYGHIKFNVEDGENLMIEMCGADVVRNDETLALEPGEACFYLSPKQAEALARVLPVLLLQIAPSGTCDEFYW